MRNNITLLDATLRDGGQGLEDGFKSNYYTAKFNDQIIASVIKKLVQANIEIIELGSIDPSLDDKSEFAIYRNIEEVSKLIPNERKDNQLFAALYIGPDTPIEQIPDWNPSLVEGVRVILRYSELQKSLDYCAALSKKGYKVFVQPMLTMRYTDQELDIVVEASNKMNAYALYIVDSYGYMEPNDIDRLFNYINIKLNADIYIGFHPHNNMNLAYANALHFTNIITNRKLILDSCIIGIGQGAGNLQTELIVPYLNRIKGDYYCYNSILDVCEIIEDNYVLDNEWGYSVTRMLPAIHKAAYKYASIFRKNYKLRYRDINQIFNIMPDDEKQRYTSENAEKSHQQYITK